MYLEPYDSPTFLAQKDKYMFGLSLPELMISLGVGALWFIVLLMFPIGAMYRIVLVLPVTGLTLAFLFVRIAGLSIPRFLFLSVLRTFRRPSFEETREGLLEGDAQWLELQRQRAESPGRFSFLNRGRRMAQLSDSQQAEVRAETDRQVNEGAVAAERMARDAIRTLLKGQ